MGAPACTSQSKLTNKNNLSISLPCSSSIIYVLLPNPLAIFKTPKDAYRNMQWDQTWVQLAYWLTHQNIFVPIPCTLVGELLFQKWQCSRNSIVNTEFCLEACCDKHKQEQQYLLANNCTKLTSTRAAVEILLRFFFWDLLNRPFYSNLWNDKGQDHPTRALLVYAVFSVSLKQIVPLER